MVDYDPMSKWALIKETARRHGAPRYPVLFAHMALRWVTLPLWVSLLPLPWLVWAFTPERRRSGPPDPLRISTLKGYFFFLSKLFFFGWDRTCLRRSLLLYYFLNREGEPVSIQFGIQKESSGDRRLGHAWITRPDGTLWMEDPKARDYVPVSTLSPFGKLTGCPAFP